MKKHIIALLSIVCLHTTGFASAAPAIQAQDGAAQEPARSNYIRTTVYTQADGMSSYDQIRYFDGLGNLRQTVNKRCTPQGKDLVTLYEYDSHKRPNITWLPVPTLNNTGAYADMDSLKTVAQAYFGDAVPYTETIYQESSLDRISHQYNAGAVFRNASKSVQTTYGTNQDAVKQIRIDLDNEQLDFSLEYPIGSLRCTTVTNEDGSKTETCTDKSNRVVRIRQATGNSDIDTHYGYDKAGRLTVVVTPKGGLTMTGIYFFRSAFVNDHCYFYRYDDLGNQIERHVPGGIYEQLRYDDKHRLVRHYNGYRLLQGRVCRQYTRLYTYDDLNRVDKVWILYCTFNRDSNDPDDYIDNKVTEPVFGASVRGLSSDLLSQTYYDGYDKVPSSLAFEIIGEMTCDMRVKGLKTYERLRMLDNLYDIGMEEASFIERAFYYDANGRLRQCVETTPDGGLIRTTYGYDFNGLEIHRNQRVRPYTGAKTDELRINKYYDHAGRLTSENTRLNSSLESIIEYTYDEQGRVTIKKLGQILEQREYNLQGWLTSLRSDHFQSSFRYYDPTYGTAPSYSGNITEWDWKQRSEPINTYAFTYDAMSRLVNSDQYIEEGTLYNAHVEKDMRYDANGNLLLLRRYHYHTPETLRFSYQGNKLTSPGVAHDNRGNMTRDGKNDFEISYNILNLPYDIMGSDDIATTYLYVADGTKYSVRDVNGNGYLYLGSLVYTITGNSSVSLESASCSGGRIFASSANGGTKYTFTYHLTDHLGSVRCIVDNTGKVLERNDYYPFGTRIDRPDEAQNSNRYLFNGKEQQWTMPGGILDYGARLYNPTLCRWHSLDPLADNYVNVSPYAYCVGNPVKFIDPDGRKIRVSGFIDNVLRTFEWREFEGQWGFYDRNNVLYNGGDAFIDDLASALVSLMQGGHAGAGLVREVANSANIVDVGRANESQANQEKSQIGWNSVGDWAATTEGLRCDPTMVLGHELAHFLDFWSGQKHGEWFKSSTRDKDGNRISISTAEIHATHVENQLRSENGLPLRTHYEFNKRQKGIGPRIITPLGESRYYNAINLTNYQPLPEGIAPFNY